MISPDVVWLTPAGSAVERSWNALPDRFPGLETDAFVIMPNHFHGIIVLGADPKYPPGMPNPSLASVVRAFKSMSGIEGNRLLNQPGQPFWQRGYHDRIIRNQRELERTRQYIANNPGRWEEDAENPATGDSAL